MVALPAWAASACTTRSRRQRAPIHRVHGAGRGGADGGADHRRDGARVPIRGDGRLQRVDAHGVTAVGVDQAQVVAAQACSLTAPPLARSRAASRAVRVLLDASTCVSSSVQAGTAARGPVARRRLRAGSVGPHAIREPVDLKERVDRP